jgi:hypothetical protein
MDLNAFARGSINNDRDSNDPNRSTRLLRLLPHGTTIVSPGCSKMFLSRL